MASKTLNTIIKKDLFIISIPPWEMNDFLTIDRKDGKGRVTSGFWFLVSGFWFLVSGFWFIGCWLFHDIGNILAKVEN